jgi:hypothetical protein
MPLRAQAMPCALSTEGSECRATNPGAFMPIVHTAKKHDDRYLDGFQIDCSLPGCNVLAFFPSPAHLPPEVVSKRFQTKRWEVNSDGNHVCPGCIEKRRHKKTIKEKGSVAAVKAHVPLDPTNIRRIIQDGQFPVLKVVPLRTTSNDFEKFRIEFANLKDINIGRLIHVERELLERCDCDMENSFISHDIVATPGATATQITVATSWTITFKRKFAEQPQGRRETLKLRFA